MGPLLPWQGHVEEAGNAGMADELGSWIINYLPDEGGRLIGKLILTERSNGAYVCQLTPRHVFNEHPGQAVSQ